jgi:hypothetical protein
MPATQPPALPPAEDIPRVDPQKVEFRGKTTEEAVPPADSIGKVEPWTRSFTEMSEER